VEKVAVEQKANAAAAAVGLERVHKTPAQVTDQAIAAGSVEIRLIDPRQALVALQKNAKLKTHAA
jgi:hypothetical protein